MASTGPSAYLSTSRRNTAADLAMLEQKRFCSARRIGRRTVTDDRRHAT
jgi:hypothetical protein